MQIVRQTQLFYLLFFRAQHERVARTADRAFVSVSICKVRIQWISRVLVRSLILIRGIVIISIATEGKVSSSSSESL